MATSYVLFACKEQNYKMSEKLSSGTKPNISGPIQL